MIDVRIQGATVQEFLDKARALVGGVANNSLSATSFTTDELLAELRDRLAKEGQVLRVLPFAEKGVTDEAPVSAGDKPKATRTRKPAAETAPAAAPELKEAPKPVTPGVQQSAPGAADGGWEGEADGKSEITLDDVKGALNAYAATHGQAAAREKMKTVGGAVKLMEVAPSKFSALVAALSIG